MRDKARNISPCLLHVSRRLKTERSSSARADSELLLIRSAVLERMKRRGSISARQLC